MASACMACVACRAVVCGRCGVREEAIACFAAICVRGVHACGPSVHVRAWGGHGQAWRARRACDAWCGACSVPSNTVCDVRACVRHVRRVRCVRGKMACVTAAACMHGMHMRGCRADAACVSRAHGVGAWHGRRGVHGVPCVPCPAYICGYGPGLRGVRGVRSCRVHIYWRVCVRGVACEVWRAHEWHTFAASRACVTCEACLACVRGRGVHGVRAAFRAVRGKPCVYGSSSRGAWLAWRACDAWRAAVACHSVR